MAAIVTTKITGANQLRNRKGQFGYVVDAEARDILNDATQVAYEVAYTNAPEDLGGIKRNLHVSSRDMSTAVISSKPHSATQEYGRRAGATPPPWRSLIGWTGRHFATTDVRRSAFIVAQSIGRKGFKGTFYMTKGGEAGAKYAQDRLRQAKHKVEVEWSK